MCKAAEAVGSHVKNMGSNKQDSAAKVTHITTHQK